MKKYWKLIAGIITAIVVVIAVFFGFQAYQQSQKVNALAKGIYTVNENKSNILHISNFKASGTINSTGGDIYFDSANNKTVMSLQLDSSTVSQMELGTNDFTFIIDNNKFYLKGTVVAALYQKAASSSSLLSKVDFSKIITNGQYVQYDSTDSDFSSAIDEFSQLTKAWKNDSSVSQKNLADLVSAFPKSKIKTTKNGYELTIDQTTIDNIKKQLNTSQKDFLTKTLDGVNKITFTVAKNNSKSVDVVETQTDGSQFSYTATSVASIPDEYKTPTGDSVLTQSDLTSKVTAALLAAN